MFDWQWIVSLLKQYGPMVGLLLALIIWQWRQITNLLDRNSNVYDDHIKTLRETQERLLTKLLGPQASSQNAPTLEQLKASVAEHREPAAQLPPSNGEKK